MFRKLISSLSYSPALVGQLGFYARRLRREEATRKIGLIFTVLALIVQSFAVFSPPESANAAGPGDFVSGGVSSLNEFLSLYDSNSNNLKDIFTSAGITRSEIAAAKYTTYNSKDTLTYGRVPQFSAAQGEKAFTYYKQDGASGQVYGKPQSLWDSSARQKQNGTTYNAWVGYSKKVGWFGIAKHCANLLTKQHLPPAPAPLCPTGTIGTPPNCTKPLVATAACDSLSVAKISRTKIRLTGTASTANDAEIKQYDFRLLDAGGNEIQSVQLNSGEQSVTSQDINLPAAGRYQAKLTVQTSLGARESAACQKAFVIAAPDSCPVNPDLTTEDSDCLPCPGDQDIWFKDEACAGQIAFSKTARNLTQALDDATTSTLNSSDKIQYHLTVKNVGNMPADVPIVEQLADVLEYSRLVDTGGGAFDRNTNTLTWQPITLQPGETQQRAFLVQLAEVIPATPQGQSDKISYDCTMTNTFGNTINLNVNCPAPKVVETVVAELPQTGLGGNLIFAGALLSVVTYFYARSRQMKKEVRLIRRDLNAGTI